MNAGTLYIVATPIGNLKDITLRALETLKEVDAIYCEDTRVTSKLLARYTIKKSLFRLDAVLERKKAPEVLQRLLEGQNLALVSDAGTPGGLADPGAYLVHFIHEKAPEIKVVPIPGASSISAALSVSGILANQYLFAGFLPHKKGRLTAIKELVKVEIPVVLFESPHRMGKLLDELTLHMPEREAVIGRELTKLYEEVAWGPVAALRERYLKGEISEKGEFVLILGPHAASRDAQEYL
jgi:16S rRNA (cytidine1402-2'-O)-methyltransferase